MSISLKNMWPPVLFFFLMIPLVMQVFLEDLPKDFKDALDQYNKNVTEDFASFLMIVSRLADMKQEYQLPLSHTGRCIFAPLRNNWKNKYSCLRIVYSRRAELGKVSLSQNKGIFSVFSRKKVCLLKLGKGQWRNDIESSHV